LVIALLIIEGHPCFIAKLPTEILTQIIRHFHNKNGIRTEHAGESSAILASIARVSHLFYQLAMPLLWDTVEIWPRRTVPYTLMEYPGTTSQRVLSHVRKMSLGTKPEDKFVDKTQCNRFWENVSKSLRVLVAADLLQDLHLYVHVFDPDEYAPKLRNKVKEINGLIFRILQHVEKMNLQNLEVTLSRKTACINDILRITEGKLNVLNMTTVSLNSWVDRLRNHQNLRRIIISCIPASHDDALDATFSTAKYDKFWIAISQLKNVAEATVDDIPISPALNLQFPHLIHLDLFMWQPRSGLELADTFLAVLKQMPSLEILVFGSREKIGFEQDIYALDIGDIACKNLRIVNISPYHPKKLLKAIAEHNPNLTSCIFEGHMMNLDDEDIQYLSRCQHLRRLTLRSPTSVTHGLAFLTNLRQLSSLDLHYSMGKYMSTQLLLDISSSCRNLRKINVSDFFTFTRSSARPFVEKELIEVFVASIELYPYIEPQYTMGRLDEYVIRLDKLRNDRSEPQ
jgi:hypothetical protein